MRQDGWIALVGMVAVLWLALVGMARPAAAHGGDANIVHACVGKVTKITRIVGPSGACSANLETALHWGIVGPAGPPGEKGDKGDQGDQGLQGLQGPTGVLGSYDDLAVLPCMTVIGTPGTAHLIGPAKSPACAVGVSANGRFVDLGLVVFDSQTNLVWEKKDQAGGLHDVDNTYTWCNATGIAVGCAVTNNWIAAVNDEGFGGFADWRVPTGRTQVDFDGGELATILLAPCPGGGTPCIDPIFGPTASSRYWSATELGANFAVVVNFSNGFVNGATEGTNFLLVRAVRGGP